MPVAAEHRYQKMNRRQFDEREQSMIISLEQTIANLKQDLAEAQSKLSDALIELDAVKERAECDVKLARKDADERCKHADYEHELMMKWWRMFSECERGHNKASAILKCLTPDQLEHAREEAKIFYPQLWKDA